MKSKQLAIGWPSMTRKVKVISLLKQFNHHLMQLLYSKMAFPTRPFAIVFFDSTFHFLHTSVGFSTQLTDRIGKCIVNTFTETSVSEGSFCIYWLKCSCLPVFRTFHSRYTWLVGVEQVALRLARHKACAIFIIVWRCLHP